MSELDKLSVFISAAAKMLWLVFVYGGCTLFILSVGIYIFQVIYPSPVDVRGDFCPRVKKVKNNS